MISETLPSYFIAVVTDPGETRPFTADLTDVTVDSTFFKVSELEFTEPLSLVPRPVSWLSPGVAGAPQGVAPWNVPVP